jgi:hypothetical protein
MSVSGIATQTMPAKRPGQFHHFIAITSGTVPWW